MLADHADVRERFERGVVAHVPQERWGEHADGGGSSIAWLVLHHSYHQDLAINTVVRDHEPLLASWRDRLGIAGCSAAAGLPEAEDIDLVVVGTLHYVGKDGLLTLLRKRGYKAVSMPPAEAASSKAGQ